MVRDFDVIIIGGSFSGMTAALALAKITGTRIAVVERQNIRDLDRKRDGRSYAISSLSLDLFREIGIFDEVSKKAGNIKDIRITDYKSPFLLDFLGKFDKEGDDILGQIIENYNIHNALRDKVLENSDKIELFCPNFYTKIDFDDNFVGVSLDDDQKLRAKLLLACDGRFSDLRAKFNIHQVEKKYNQMAIVFNIFHEKSHKNVAYEKFLPGGPLAILPLQDQNKSSIVWIVKDDLADIVLDLDEKNFVNQLQKKMENCLGEVKVISEKFHYPLGLIEAESFSYKRMLLIGDAACGIHPIAGQGFNLAVSGIKILQGLVRNNLECGFDILGQDLVAKYNKKAGLNAKKMLMATDLLNSLFETRNLSISIVRDLGLGLVNKMPKLKKFFIKAAGGF